MQLVRSDSADQIQSYGDAFFRAGDLRWLPGSEGEIVVQHLLSRLEESGVSLSPGLVRTSIGLGHYIDISKMSKFADTLIRLVLRQPDSLVESTISFVSQLYDDLDSAKKNALEVRLKVWIKNSENQGTPVAKKLRLTKIAGNWVDFPF